MIFDDLLPHDLSFFSSFFSDICSSFDVFFLFFPLFISSVFLLVWGSALFPLGLAGVLMGGYCGCVGLADGGGGRALGGAWRGCTHHGGSLSPLVNG